MERVCSDDQLPDSNTIMIATVRTLRYVPFSVRHNLFHLISGTINDCLDYPEACKRTRENSLPYQSIFLEPQ